MLTAPPVAVLHCARCAAALTGPVRRVPLPEPGTAPPLHRPGPNLMPARTYATDPAPHSAARLCGTYVLAPGDVHHVRFILENCEIGCFGLDGYHGPNLACAGCGAEVGSRADDCYMWQETRLYPSAVCAESAAADVVPVVADEGLGRRPFQDGGDPDWLWFGNLAVAAAGVLARSGGVPVRFTERVLPVRDFLAGALYRTSHRDALRGPSAGPGDGPSVVCDLGAPWNLTVGRDDVRVDEHVWAYLADDRGRTAGTRWRPGLAAVVHRDEPVHWAHSADMLGYGHFTGHRDVARALGHRPERHDPWLAGLLRELAPFRPGRGR
ncbi:hypothetical protein GCM10010191_84190 [Actinomadura vinacea]|uniref:Uncharacterized protein n=1 Tax=Actinomadura vinacea TaxID=115336 RepID=A0ABN3K8U1_9ACTN